MTNDMSSSSASPIQTQVPVVIDDKNAALAALFMNKSKHSSQDLAEAKNLVYRLVSVNGETFLGYPTDGNRDDRICCEIVNGKVVVAKIC